MRLLPALLLAACAVQVPPSGSLADEIRDTEDAPVGTLDPPPIDATVPEHLETATFALG